LPLSSLVQLLVHPENPSSKEWCLASWYVVFTIRVHFLKI